MIQIRIVAAFGNNAKRHLEKMLFRHHSPSLQPQDYMKKTLFGGERRCWTSLVVEALLLP